MKEDKPKSIRTIGIVLAILSVLVVLSNTAGLFMINYLTEGGNKTIETPYFESLAYAKPIAIISSALALGFLVAGIFITRYKNWARVLAQIVAVFYLLCFWYQSIFITPYNPFDKGEFGVEQLVGMLIWSVPVVFLIVYLNKEKIKNHFA